MTPRITKAVRVLIWVAILAVLAYGAVVSSEPSFVAGPVALAGSLIAAAVMFCFDRTQRQE